MTNKEKIIKYIADNPLVSSFEIFTNSGIDFSYASLRRELVKLCAENIIIVVGNRKSSRYSVSPIYRLLQTLNIDTYFQKEIDERVIVEAYNFELLETLVSAPAIFTANELELLCSCQEEFLQNIMKLTDNARKKEMDRLGVDLSWKSSQIEGNTYTLLETERLLMEKETASGKTRDEAIMLLNHKNTLDFIIDNVDYLNELTIAKLESIHYMLTKGLDIDRNIRSHRVGITGTNYRPLDNEFQIKEALISTCELVNEKDNIFEKALLVLLLISYIQPFNDGNKRTARIVSNAILIANNYCPISFRSVVSIDYKKAMLIFYEQNNMSAFKNIFIEQFKFAVKTYF